MANPIKLSDLNQTKFYQLPKAFFHNPVYMDMKNDSKIAYALLRDLLDLSIQNQWINENNEVYVKLSRTKLMNYLNIKGTQKFAQIMKELKDKELLIYKKIGLKQCNEIYICMPEELDIIYSDAELLEKDLSNDNLNVKENENCGLKIKPQEVRKSNFKRFENQTHIKTNNIKTNNINTINKKNKEEKKAHKGYKAIIEEYTDTLELQQAIYSFIEMRKAIKSTMTDRALTMLLNKLNTLADNDLDKTEILNNSTMNSWKSVFALEQEKKSFRSNTKGSEILDKINQRHSTKKDLNFKNFDGRGYTDEDYRFVEVRFGSVDIASIDRDKLNICKSDYDKYIKDNNIEFNWENNEYNGIQVEQRVITPNETKKANTEEYDNPVYADLLQAISK